MSYARPKAKVRLRKQKVLHVSFVNISKTIHSTFSYQIIFDKSNEHNNHKYLLSIYIYKRCENQNINEAYMGRGLFIYIYVVILESEKESLTWLCKRTKEQEPALLHRSIVCKNTRTQPNKTKDDARLIREY